MSCVEKINTNTLVRIIRYAVGPKAYTLSQWKPKLKYLHVCTLWADIVKPLVLTEGFIDLDVAGKSKTSPSARMVDLAYCESNTHILIHHGYHHYVSSFRIRSFRHIIFRFFFSQVLLYLQPNVYEWPAVNILEIEMYFGSDENLYKFGNRSKGDNPIDFVDTIYKSMPFVNHLTIHEYRKESAFIANPLANRYMKQLVYLSTSGSIDFSVSHFCSDLRWLEISLNHKGKNKIYLPQLRAAPLETLSLLEVPQQFSWAEFYDADGPDITFYNLNFLRLNFSSIHNHSNDDKVVSARFPQRFIYHRLHFPKLSKLTLSDCPPNSEFFYCQKYFRNLELLNISGHIPSIEHVQNMGFHTLKDLVVTLFTEKISDKRTFYAATNYLFSTLKVSQHVYLYNLVDISYNDIQYIEWTFLKCIYLQNTICFNVFIRLVTVLPNIIWAMAFKLVTDKPTSYVSDIGLDDKPDHLDAAKGRATFSTLKSLFSKPRPKKPSNVRLEDTIIQKVAANVVPVSSLRIKAMTLFFNSTEDSYSRMIAAICCIVASFPSLIKLHLSPQFTDFNRYFAQLESSYKSLSNISVELLEEEVARAKAINEFTFY